MFDKVLLPIDLTHRESWQSALPAARFCAGPEGEVHILGIVHDLGAAAMVTSYLPEGYEQMAMEKLKVALQEFAASHQEDGKTLQIHVGHGHVPETILRISDQIGASIIVMASHPPSHFQTLLVASNANKVVRHSTIPVLVVR